VQGLMVFLVYSAMTLHGNIIQTVRPELVEGCLRAQLVLRQAQDERFVSIKCYLALEPVIALYQICCLNRLTCLFPRCLSCLYCAGDFAAALGQLAHRQALIFIACAHRVEHGKIYGAQN
jgi:hypothetical protein